ncbi:MAG TPA: hypothetical protein VHF22_05260, partial [Planctomycetota bacterium]|nr:hypothetical protein [Planctomycetota bacterium]
RDVVPEVLRAGGRIEAYRHREPGSARRGLWFDVGTPEALLEANLALHPGGATAPSAVVDEGATVRRAVIRSQARVGAGASVEDAFVLEGAVIEPGARVRRAVIGPRVRVRAGAVVGPSARDPGRVVVVALPDELS